MADEFVIWKFPLPDDPEATIRMPKHARLLSVQTQRGEPMIWALVDPRAEIVRRRFWIMGTGSKFSPRGLGDFIGTIQVAQGALVFHIFDGGELT